MRPTDRQIAALTTLTDAGRATVTSFDERQREMVCDTCGRSWGGTATWCYRCGEDSGDPQDSVATWHIVSCGRYRFNVPPASATDAMRRIATPGDAHNPTQPQREIPDIGLTIEAQFRCVEMVIERLAAGAVHDSFRPACGMSAH